MFILATVASVKNIGLIVYNMADGDLLTTVSLTATLALSAIGFIAAGERGGAYKAAIAAIITVEVLCNLTGAYYGLLGRTGLPTRFLGMLTDIFNIGTHAGAIAAGLVFAVIIGAVQILSLKGIVKQ